MNSKFFQVLLFLFGAIALLYDYAPPNKSVEVVTSEGSFTIELFANEAPLSVKNFLQYVEDRHYDGTVFHRVMKDFMIQGGGLTTSLEPKDTRSAIQNEAPNGLKNLRGRVGMARIDEIHSATDQFYINVVDNDFLDHKDNSEENYGYAVFGQVTSGMDVVDKISMAATEEKNDYKNLPQKPIIIQEIR